MGSKVLDAKYLDIKIVMGDELLITLDASNSTDPRNEKNPAPLYQGSWNRAEDPTGFKSILSDIISLYPCDKIKILLEGNKVVGIARSEEDTSESNGQPGKTLFDIGLKYEDAIKRVNGVNKYSPCPCGAGGKYKFCHMEKDLQLIKQKQQKKSL